MSPLRLWPSRIVLLEVNGCIHVVPTCMVYSIQPSLVSLVSQKVLRNLGNYQAMFAAICHDSVLHTEGTLFSHGTDYSKHSLLKMVWGHHFRRRHLPAWHATACGSSVDLLCTLWQLYTVDDNIAFCFISVLFLRNIIPRFCSTLFGYILQKGRKTIRTKLTLVIAILHLKWCLIICYLNRALLNLGRIYLLTSQPF